MNRFILSAFAALLLLANLQPAISASAPGEATTFNRPAPEDDVAIRHLLDTYTKSVMAGDRARFESQLLDLSIPFYGVTQGRKPVERSGLAIVQDYAGFRGAIFDSGKKFRQTFSNIKIEQVGNLAQVSLDYQTAPQDQAYAFTRWKVLQLIKLDGQWKIASEFYTGYPIR